MPTLGSIRLAGSDGVFAGWRAGENAGCRQDLEVEATSADAARTALVLRQWAGGRVVAALR
ncbi:hypothetical protein [Thermasporomyces composti]|uniref:hypothetical protein n=1 Tax=Thermasporomyces composti TaxID=696763 RepID=UPI0011C06FAC|nr:hypothetical protein [Thermasporomyces composti]